MMNKIWKEFVTCFVYRDVVESLSNFSCLAFDLPIAKNNNNYFYLFLFKGC